MTGSRAAPARHVDPADLLALVAPSGGLLASVPCSVLGPVLDVARRSPSWRYLPATSEGEAVAIAAGVAAAGGRGAVAMQNSGLGHALDPLVSLAFPFEIPLFLLVSHRGKPPHETLAQHAVMGRITHDLLRLAGVPAIDLGSCSTGEVAEQWARSRSKGSTLAVVVPPGILGRCLVSSQPGDAHAAEERDGGESWGEASGRAGPVSRAVAVEAVVASAPPAAVLVSTTGHTSRQLFALADADTYFYLSGSMGYSSAFALGVSLQRPDLEVVVLDGDGAALMHLGNLATVGAFGGPKYRHVVLDNGVNGSTGSQPTAAPWVSFTDIAVSLGYVSARSSADFGSVGEAVAWVMQARGPALLHIPITAAEPPNLPRIGVPPAEQASRFRHVLGVPDSRARSS